jgi:hypothetical protein
MNQKKKTKNHYHKEIKIKMQIHKIYFFLKKLNKIFLMKKNKL